jgi:hypothetical protein
MYVMGMPTKQSDFGERLFVADVLVTVAATSVLTIIGAGLHFSWLIVAYGVFCFLFNLWLASGLYGGQRRSLLALGWLAFQALIAVVLVGALFSQSELGLAKIGLPGLGGTWSLLLIAALQALFGVVLQTPAVQAFLAHQRGETLPERPVVVAADDGVLWKVDGTAAALEEKPKRAIASLSLYAEMTAFVLLFLAGLDLVGAVWWLISFGSGWSLIPVGVFALLLGLVLWTTADDLHYLATTKGSEQAHLTHIVADMKVLAGLVTVGAAIAALALVIGLLMMM